MGLCLGMLQQFDRIRLLLIMVMDNKRLVYRESYKVVPLDKNNLGSRQKDVFHQQPEKILLGMILCLDRIAQNHRT